MSDLSVLSSFLWSTILVSSPSALSTYVEFAMLVANLSTPFAFARPGPGLSTQSTPVESTVPMLVPSFSTLSVFAESAMSIPGLFAFAISIFSSYAFSTLVMTLTPGRQKLIKLNQR